MRARVCVCVCVCVCVYVCMYTNRSKNDLKFCYLGFYYFLYLCFTNVSNCFFFRRIEMAKLSSGCSFYCK